MKVAYQGFIGEVSHDLDEGMYHIAGYRRSDMATGEAPELSECLAEYKKSVDMLQDEG